MMKNLFANVKKTLIVALATAALAVSGPLTGIQPSASAASCDGGSFLGFPTWYRGLECSDGAVEIDSSGTIFNVVLIIALNIVDIVLRLLSFVAIGFIIFGGFLYMTAHGEPGNVAKGKAALTQAIVGLIIGVASSAIVGFVITRLGQ